MPVENVNTAPRIKSGGIPAGVGQPIEPSMADQILKIRQGSLLEKVAAKEYGLNPPPAAPPASVNQEQSLAASVVTKAMEVQTQAADRAQKMADRNDDIARQARADADKAQKDVLLLTLQEMQRVTTDVQKNMMEMVKGNKPPGLAESIKEFKELTALLTPAGATPVRPVEQAPQRDYKIEMSLQEMNHNHEISMKKLDLELAKLQASIALSRAEFEDNKHRKDREYEESISFRNNAMTNIGKIAQAAAASFGPAGVGAKVDQEDEAADIGEDAREQPVPMPDKEPKATVQNFPCQFCHTMLTVPPGGGEVECSNDQCKAKYKIDV